MLRNAGEMDGRVVGLSSQPNALRTGSNSGYQAIGLALAAGAKTVVLLGFDMRFVNGKSHWHAGHPTKDGEEMYRATYANQFASLPPLLGDRKIINVSPVSVLTCFPKMALEEVE